MKKPSVKSQRDEVLRYVKSKYGSDAEYLWARYPTYAVVRRVRLDISIIYKKHPLDTVPSAEIR